MIVDVFTFLLLSYKGAATVPTVHKPRERKIVLGYFLFCRVAPVKNLLHTDRRCLCKGREGSSVGRTDVGSGRRAISLQKNLHRHEARCIQMALEDASGNISGAARLLGLRRPQTLGKILRRRHKNLRHVLDDVLAFETEMKLESELITELIEVTSKEDRVIRILHVEDDPTLARLVNEIAKDEGWELQHIGEGIGASEELASDSHYDLLLVDFQLPGLDGLELVRQARSMVHRQGMRIVMMSGRLDEATAIKAGADVFLRKPQDIGLLVETINRLPEKSEQDQ